jgi:hypothetical protein
VHGLRPKAKPKVIMDLNTFEMNPASALVNNNDTTPVRMSRNVWPLCKESNISGCEELLCHRDVDKIQRPITDRV